MWVTEFVIRFISKNGITDDVELNRLILYSISRAIWGQKVQFAKNLLSKVPWAHSFLRVSPQGVFCPDLPGFTSIYNETKLEQQQKKPSKLEALATRETSDNIKKQIKSRSQATRRMTTKR